VTTSQSGRGTVSVVIPTYNRAQFVGEAIESVLGQTARPLEIIVVDDGSTDDTEAVCRKFGAQIRYIRQANGGVSAARNHGIRESRGDLIAFLDSDDRWAPEKLELQAGAIEASDGVRWSFTGCQVMARDGTIREDRPGYGSSLPIFADTGQTPEVLLGARLAKRIVGDGAKRTEVFVGDSYALFFRGNLAYPSSVMVARDLVAEAGGFDEAWRVAEETECFHRWAARAPVVVLPQSLLFWRENAPGSLTNPTNTVRLVSHAIQSLDRAYALRRMDPPDAEITRAYREGRSTLGTRLAWARLTNYESTAARETAREVWRTDGPNPKLAGIIAASFFPSAILRVLHRLKRVATGAGAKA
jgi:glycosyltransferase involved in cell wall biosynthesis